MLQYIKKRAGLFALLCALIVFLLPYQSLAQEASEAMTQARMDAQRDANGTMWFILSCLFGVIPLLLAYVIDPSPPMGRLMGKSPEYVATYTDTYRAEVKSIRTKNALWGCLLGTGISCALYVVLLAASASSY